MKKKAAKLHIFLWEGIDSSGMKVKGEKETVDHQSAQTILRQSGITPLKIKRKPSSTFSKLKNKIKTQDVTTFSKDPSNLISANIPLATSLELIQKNAQKPSLKKLIETLRKQVDSGKSLAETFRSYPLYFDDIFCSLIEAGERSGTLNIMLKNITEHQEKSMKLKRTIKKALLYPITVLVISLFVTAALLIFIVPQFADLFQNVGAELPVLTQIMIHLSDMIYTNLKIIGAIIISSLLITKILFAKSEKFTALLDKLFLKTPLFGNILKLSILARSFHTLSILLRTGIPLTEALNVTAKISNNKIYLAAFYDISKKISAGHTIHQSLQMTQKFPEIVSQMIAIGEASGTLENMLKNLGEYFEERTDDITYNLGQLLEPAIMIFLSLIVGIIVIAMYLPIFKLGAVI